MNEACTCVHPLSEGAHGCYICNPDEWEELSHPPLTHIFSTFSRTWIYKPKNKIHVTLTEINEILGKDFCEI
jgi:hypothetical protein